MCEKEKTRKLLDCTKWKCKNKAFANATAVDRIAFMQSIFQTQTMFFSSHLNKDTLLADGHYFSL